MSYFIARRIVERTSSPQPVYTTIVDQTVRTWAPIAVAALSSFCTPAARPVDVRTHYPSSPAFTWVAPVVDAQVQTWMPAATSELASFRTPDGLPSFDIRKEQWRVNAYGITAAANAAVASWAPVFSSELASFRTPGDPALDVRDVRPPIDGWVNYTLPVSLPQQSAAHLQAKGTNFRTIDRPLLDVRAYEWAPSIGWITQSLHTLYAKAAGGNWSSASTWSRISSAGTDSAGPPDATFPYDVILDAGSGNVTLDVTPSCRSLNCNGYTGVLTHNTGVTFSIGHSTPGPSNVLLFFSAGMTYTPADATSAVIFSPSGSTPQTVQTNGKVLWTLTISGSGGSTILLDALTVTGNLIHSAGTFNTAGFTLTCATYTVAGGTSTFGASTINLTRTTTGNVFTFTSGVLNAGTSNLVIQNASANTRTIAGGGATFYDLTYTVAGSTGGLVITGANTFHAINFSDVTNARTLTLPASATTTATTLNINGTSGKKMSIVSSSSGTAATLSIASGTISDDYLSLKDSAATGGATFYAGNNSTDVSGNSGWIFSSPVAQLWPATLLGTGNNYRTLDHALLDVRNYEWQPSFAWVTRVTDAAVAQQSAIYRADRLFRTPDGVTLDVRSHLWVLGTAWIQSILTPGVTVPQQIPAILLASGLNFRTADHLLLDVRAQEWQPSQAWISPLILPQQWPAIALATGISYRTLERALLDVRSYTWQPSLAWVTRSADLALPRMASLPSERISFRTRDGARLDLRSYNWMPSLAWIHNAIPPTTGFPFQIITADVIVTESVRGVLYKGGQMGINPLLTITSGWTGVLGPFTLLVDSVPLNLTGFTVELSLSSSQGAPITPGGVLTILNQSLYPGQVTYAPVPTDFVYQFGQGISRRQTFRLHWKVTDGNGLVVYFPNSDASEIGVYCE